MVKIASNIADANKKASDTPASLFLKKEIAPILEPEDITMLFLRFFRPITFRRESALKNRTNPHIIPIQNTQATTYTITLLIPLPYTFVIGTHKIDIPEIMKHIKDKLKNNLYFSLAYYSLISMCFIQLSRKFQ